MQEEVWGGHPSIPCLVQGVVEAQLLHRCSQEHQPWLRPRKGLCHTEKSASCGSCRCVRKRENRSSDAEKWSFSLQVLLATVLGLGVSWTAVLFSTVKKKKKCLSSPPSNLCELSGSTLPQQGFTQVCFCVKSCLILLFSALFPYFHPFTSRLLVCLCWKTWPITCAAEFYRSLIPY